MLSNFSLIFKLLSLQMILRFRSYEKNEKKRVNTQINLGNTSLIHIIWFKRLRD